MTITAGYAGDSNNPSSVGTYSLTVALKTSETTVSCKPTSVVAGSSTAIKCTAKVTGYSPTGNVAWSQVGGTGSVTFVSSTCTLSKGRTSSATTSVMIVTDSQSSITVVTEMKSSVGMTCSVTMNGTTAGTVTAQAAYGGDSNNMVSSNTTELTIRPARTSLSVSCTSSSVPVGSFTSCTSTLRGYVGSVAGETVTWSQTGTGSVSLASTTCTLSLWTCSVTMTGFTSGHVTIAATYTGDPNNQGSSRTTKLTIKIVR